jgi:hypothetical protein
MKIFASFSKKKHFLLRAAAPPTPRAPSVLFCKKEPKNFYPLGDSND